MLKEMEKKMKDLKEVFDPRKKERIRRAEKKSAMKKGLALGTFFGALTGIFFAPDTGKNTREKTKVELEKIKTNIQENVTEGKEKLEENLIEGKEKFVEFYEDKKEVINNQISNLKEKKSDELNMVDEEDLHMDMDLNMDELFEEED